MLKASEDSVKRKIMRLFQALQDHYDFDRGWPGGEWPINGRFNPSRFEIIVGAVLTQNTKWENVEMALSAMVERGLTSAGEIVRAETASLEAAVRCSGFYRQKASALQNLCRLWEDGMGMPPAGITRSELLEITRIGPETADSILLYALGRPEFIADAYTRRLAFRLGYFCSPPDYTAVKAIFEQWLPQEVPLFQKFHALIVQHVKKFCRIRPVCSGCPLRVSGGCHWRASD